MSTQATRRTKYPFHDKIDLDVPPALQCIFSETYSIISNILSRDKEQKDAEPNFCDEDIDSKDVEEDYMDYNDEQEEKDTLSMPSSKTMIKAKAKAKANANATEQSSPSPVLMPMSESEIRREMQASMELLQNDNEMKEYEEQVIESITHQFERKYFRSPSLSEIALILSTAVQKMKASPSSSAGNQNAKRLNKEESRSTRRLSKSQKLLVQQSGRDVIAILDTAEDVVIEYLVENARESGMNMQQIHEMLMSRIALFN